MRRLWHVKTRNYEGLDPMVASLIALASDIKRSGNTALLDKAFPTSKAKMRDLCKNRLEPFFHNTQSAAHRRAQAKFERAMLWVARYIRRSK